MITSEQGKMPAVKTWAQSFMFEYAVRKGLQSSHNLFFDYVGNIGDSSCRYTG